MEIERMYIRQILRDEAGDGEGSAGDRGDTAVLDGDGDDASQKDDSGDKSGEADDKKAADAKADDGKDPKIPKSRFDEAVKKERDQAAAEKKRADDLQAKLDAGAVKVDLAKLETEIEGLEDELDKALADNDPVEKRRIRAEIRARTETIAEAKAEARGRYATAVAVEQIRYDNAVSKLEDAHPALNPDHESYDEELAGQMLELKGAYEATGLSSTEALNKAAKFVLKAAPAPAKKDAKDDKGEAKDQAALEAEAKRKEDAVKKALEAKGKQPAAGKGVGAGSEAAGKKGDNSDVGQMSEKDFDALPEDEKKRRRGDSV